MRHSVALSGKWFDLSSRVLVTYMILCVSFTGITQFEIQSTRRELLKSLSWKQCLASRRPDGKLRFCGTAALLMLSTALSCLFISWTRERIHNSVTHRHKCRVCGIWESHLWWRYSAAKGKYDCRGVKATTSSVSGWTQVKGQGYVQTMYHRRQKRMQKENSG
jgi:hypothetical protein